MATTGLRTGSDAATAPPYAVAQPLPRGGQLEHGARCRAPLPADRRRGRSGTVACPAPSFSARRSPTPRSGAWSTTTAAGLQRLGVKKGTKVGLLLPNTPTFIVYFFAVLKAGGTVVNFNPLYTVNELAGQVKDSDTELMITLDLKVLFDKVDALLQSRGTASRGGVLVHRPSARRQGRPVPHVQSQGPRPASAIAGARAHRHRGRSRRGRRQTLPRADRPSDRRRGAAVHRRHHRHAQGRHAHARQHLRQRAAGRRVGARARRRRRSGSSASCRSSMSSR